MNLKKIATTFIFLFLSLVALCARDLSNAEQQAIDDFMLFRVKITTIKDFHKALKTINEYQEQNKSLITSFSDEAQLIINNFIVLEQYNYIYNIDINDSNLQDLILSQNSKNDKWFDAHNKNTINKWLYCTAADIKSCCLQFVSKTDAMKIGLSIKDYYKTALKLDKNMSYALFGLGQWLIQAPAIAGGNKNDAIETFKLAVNSSRNNAETFYGYIFLSQAYFTKKETSKASNMLTKALSIEPQSNYIAFIKILNESNYSLYYYVTHREKIDKKLNLS